MTSAEQRGAPIGAAASSTSANALAASDEQACEARLHHLELENAGRLVELDDICAALGEREREQLDAGGLSTAMVTTSAHVVEAERRIAAYEAEAAQLRLAHADLTTRLACAQEALDLREAELYETEEAVQLLEARSAARARELAETREQCKKTEERLLARQREAARAVAMADGAAASIWRSPDGRGLRRGHSDEADADAQARALRVSKSKADPAEAGYTQFHTLCMGIKLAAGPANPRLRNVSIDELWEEVQQQQVPRGEWRRFVHAALVKSTPPPTTLHDSAAQLAKGLLSGVERIASNLAEAVVPPVRTTEGG